MIVFSNEEPEAVKGLFGVLKSHTAHRLIIDAQNANTLFVDPLAVDLPNLGDLKSLVLGEETLWICKSDIDSYY